MMTASHYQLAVAYRLMVTAAAVAVVDIEKLAMAWCDGPKSVRRGSKELDSKTLSWVIALLAI